MQVLAAIPLFTGIIIQQDDDLLMIICLSAAIFTAAIGVRILVRVNIVQSAFNILLREGDYFKRKRIKKKEPADNFPSYGCILACCNCDIYLIYGAFCQTVGD